MRSLRNIVTIRGLFALLIFLTALSSCNRKMHLSNFENVKPKDIATIIDTTSLEFTEMKARFRIHADLNGDKRSFNADIRWDWNEKIWISMSIFGIEGVRALFTRDSIKILNKLENEYYYGDYESLTKLSKVELSFDEMEELLLGRLFGIHDKKPGVRFNGDEVILTMQDALYNATVNLDRKTVSIQQYWINSLSSPRKLEVTLSDYEVIGNKRWPNQRDYRIESGDTYLKVDATSQKMVLNEKLEYPFKINPRYQRIPL